MVCHFGTGSQRIVTTKDKGKKRQKQGGGRRKSEKRKNIQAINIKKKKKARFFLKLSTSKEGHFIYAKKKAKRVRFFIY